MEDTLDLGFEEVEVVALPPLLSPGSTEVPLAEKRKVRQQRFTNGETQNVLEARKARQERFKNVKTHPQVEVRKARQERFESHLADNKQRENMFRKVLQEDRTRRLMKVGLESDIKAQSIREGRMNIFNESQLEENRTKEPETGLDDKMATSTTSEVHSETHVEEPDQTIKRTSQKVSPVVVAAAAAAVSVSTRKVEGAYGITKRKSIKKVKGRGTVRW
eukprot:TRINITY_DN219_c0_g2_i11.p1 TRINITY_DN219_c0_g2~~TRINITY_DN219_c0_g2_i11.p1  ORF type:complete len:245 (+),score=53.19 TRINITY_DN219_c0_g2_i11:81-737(+)